MPTIQECPVCGNDEFDLTDLELRDAQGFVECDTCAAPRLPIHEMIVVRTLNMISQGFKRESLIRFVEMKGFSESYAVRVIDEAFVRIAEQYK